MTKKHEKLCYKLLFFRPDTSKPYTHKIGWIKKGRLLSSKKRWTGNDEWNKRGLKWKRCERNLREDPDVHARKCG